MLRRLFAAAPVLATVVVIALPVVSFIRYVNAEERDSRHMVGEFLRAVQEQDKENAQRAAPQDDGPVVQGRFAQFADASSGVTDDRSTSRHRRLAFAPNAVTTLQVVAATDTSLVLSWTEVSTNGAGIAKYVVRIDTLGRNFQDWGVEFEISRGGCGAPVYGSTAAGGRVRSCVLGGLKPQQYYQIAIRAFTGTMNVNAVYGPISNIAAGITAVRVGPMLVQRPKVNWNDTVEVASFTISEYPDRRFPLFGRFNLGPRFVEGYDYRDSLVARGYLLVVKP